MLLPPSSLLTLNHLNPAAHISAHLTHPCLPRPQPTLYLTPIPVQITIRPERQPSNPTRPVNLHNLIRPPTLSHLVICTPATSLASMCLLNVRSLHPKSAICQNYILSNNIDFFMITESWLGPHDTVSLKATTPPGYSCLDRPRLTSKGGGLALIYRDTFKCSLIDFGSFSSFEILAFLIKGKLPLLCVLIYRPPKLPGFIDEFSELLAAIMAKYDRVQIHSTSIAPVVHPPLV